MQTLPNTHKQRILLSYLNWGKGHLSRCIGLCRQLKAQGNELFIACTAEDATVFNAYMDDLHYLPFEGYPFHFSGKGNFANDLWNNRKELAAFLYTEQEKVEELVKENHIQLVISDHRYGFRSTAIPSIFVAHQIQLALKWWQLPAQWIHKSYLKSFDAIWIMDDEQHSLAGKLSKKTLPNASYIGHFSRFEHSEIEKDMILGVVNGPQPYDQQLLQKLVENPAIDVIISTISSTDTRVIHPANWKEVDAVFYQAKCIYGYCGYSTLMDIKQLKTQGILFATPGQTEQEYLVKTHSSINFSILGNKLHDSKL